MSTVDAPLAASPPSRRDLFRLAAIAGIAGAAPAIMAQAGGGGTPTGLTKYRLVHATSFGFTNDLAGEFDSRGWTGFLDWQLNPDAIDDAALNARLAPYTTLEMTPKDILTIPKGGPNPANELIEATILRQVYSGRQLFERMVMFWTDLFNIDYAKVKGLKTIHDREVIRPHALGSYYDLLIYNAHSPAMLHYLDNDSSVKAHPNQNYARELMELHTLGVDGGYTQQDVVEVARCFTGWTWVRNSADPNYGVFHFNESAHDDGQKTVLGVTIPAKGGIEDGRLALDILAHHPATYRRISKRMCSWLLGYQPPAALVDEVVAVARSSQWDTKAMIRTILGNPSTVRGQTLKLKRPLELMESAIRAIDGDVTSASRLHGETGRFGETPFRWAPPNGYPDALAYWGDLVLARWNVAFELMANGLGVKYNEAKLLGSATTSSQIAERINVVLFGGEMPSGDKALVKQFLDTEKTPTKLAMEAFGLAMALPGFQWY